MKVSVFSLLTYGSNNQNMEKINRVDIRFYDVDQYNVVTKILDIFRGKCSRSAGIFISTFLVISKYEKPWSDCITLWVDNTSANVKYKSLIVEARKRNENAILMSCLYHIGHKKAGKNTKSICDHITEHFDIEELRL